MLAADERFSLPCFCPSCTIRGCASTGLVDDGADVRAGIQAIAQAEFLRRARPACSEILVDAAMDDDAAGGSAALAGGAEGAPEDALHRQIQVGVVHAR